MNDIKKIKIFTILIHSFIIIGAGHGIGIMGMIDIASIPNLIDNYEFTISGNFDDNIMSIGLLSLIGKIMLIISLFVKINRIKNLTGIIGISLLWITVYFLTSGNWDYSSLYKIAFWTSVPFLISSIILTYLIIKNIKQNTEQNIELNEQQKV
ncbi:hypothetical protein C7H62_0499 [Mesoflavibacter sp. HG96]|uniref:hypothetical protein n=1 Tax=Mesoflavibacter TaxID=444051 RepID=UPI000D0EFB07|nr:MULTISPECIES: hypothetical protein [Mesoflavibacter]QIJ88308.1 hypothetical protein C7H62_0499 [Mesoflavibacter sp. HG96]QIJ91036.1 hypothetical protein C7H56_0499 [Mesoflavibacter sp. HG37]